KEKVAVSIHIRRSSIGRVRNVNRTHPSGPAIRGTVKFPKITSEESGPKLIDESVTHTAHIRINSEPFLITAVAGFIGRLLDERLAAVCGTPQIVAKK